MRTAPHNWLDANCRMRPDGLYFDGEGNLYRPATDDEAQHGLNDTWPGDPVRVSETAAERLARVHRTPVGLLTADEIELLDPAGQEYARKFQERRIREAACPGHERVETATREQANRGNHRGECRHCGKDMSWDSGD